MALSGVLLGALTLWAQDLRAAAPADIVVFPQAGQTAEQARRDRYECHNWAVQQIDSVPLAGPEAQTAARERRAERLGKVFAGAAVGAAAGSVIRGARDHRDAGDGALGGAVLGAIAGAVIGERNKDDSPDVAFDEYFRALDACMSGRGYSLAIGDDKDS